MTVQFAGANDNRRRRRLAVSGENPSEEMSALQVNGTGIASELVTSSAAAPWVPLYEWRIWTYAALLGLVLIGVSVSLARPAAFKPQLAPLTSHLLLGERPVLAVVVQTLFWFLSAQLAVLIGWYRAQCKLDFSGRYRVWPWVATACFVAAFSSATNAHGLVGEIVLRREWLDWKSATVAWLLPAVVISLPLVLLVDRDVRRGFSTLCTLRTAWVLGLTSVCVELFHPELSRMGEWIHPVRRILPLVAGATLFVGLWLHARVVAFVCPDPPDAEQAGVGSQLFSAWTLCAAGAVAALGAMSVLMFWKRWKLVRASDVDAEAKPKRKTKAKSDEDAEATSKRKKKAPAKKSTTSTKSRTRTKPVEEEVEEEEDTAESGWDEADSTDESDSGDNGYESESDYSETSEEDQWEEEETPPPPPPRSQKNGSGGQSAAAQSASSAKAGSKTASPPTRQEPARSASKGSSHSYDDADEDSDDDDSGSYRVDDGQSPDQLKGLSKRQKRELKKQMRDQQRNR